MSNENIFIFFNYEKKSIDEIQNLSNVFLEKIKSRRSIREYSAIDIPDNIIKNIITSAGSAPSGANKQPWLYCIIKNPDLKQKIRQKAERIEKANYERIYSKEFLGDLKQFKTNFSKPFLQEAPVLIALFKEKYRIKDGKNEKVYFANESCGISLGFLINAIHFSGLVTVCYTINQSNFLNDLLDIPDNFSLYTILPVGYPKEGTTIPDISKRNLEDISKWYD